MKQEPLDYDENDDEECDKNNDGHLLNNWKAVQASFLETFVFIC